jgi:V8-like Glu-specific endopeptidase
MNIAHGKGYPSAGHTAGNCCTSLVPAGTLILPNVVMSAAHCLNQTEESLRLPVVQIGRFFVWV